MLLAWVYNYLVILGRMWKGHVNGYAKNRRPESRIVVDLSPDFSMAGADGLRSVTVGYGPEILGFFQRDSDRWMVNRLWIDDRCGPVDVYNITF